jgi:hypothetical protein
MDGKLLEPLAGELAAAMRADGREYLERLAAVAFIPLILLVPGICDDLIHFF